jgi:hypothetical protein
MQFVCLFVEIYNRPLLAGFPTSAEGAAERKVTRTRALSDATLIDAAGNRSS